MILWSWFPFCWKPFPPHLMRWTEASLFLNGDILLKSGFKISNKTKHLASCLVTRKEPSFINKYYAQAP